MELLHDLLTRAAAATPEACVIESVEPLTYGQLDARSTTLSRLLVDCGAGPGVPIALCVEKGAGALVAIFAILKSGSCYVPLDPRAPSLRLAAILSQAAPVAAVVDGAGAVAIEAASSGDGSALAILRVDGTADAAADAAAAAAAAAAFGRATPPTTGASGEDPAYILFTSGSTGVPKGVALSHRAALAFVESCLRTFGVTGADRVSSHASLTFDLSIFDVFVAVAAGATIVPITGSALVFPQTLADLIDDREISVWYSVPFALVQLIERGGLERRRFERLRTVLFAGEPLAVAHLRTLMRHWSGARFFNLYGPTETNAVTWYEAGAAQLDTLPELPIGRPWPDYEIRILDQAQREVAPGEPGELCVRSPTTMSGYWRAPQASAAAFTSLPVDWSPVPQPFYRTGDTVRERDGLLWFLGRRDGMVKIRGGRVELGEVEAVLRRHPQVAEVAAFALPHDQLGAELVAVATAVHAGDAPRPRDLLAFCADHLPAYMRPGRVELLGSLPRTTTGKLDRQALARDLPATDRPTGVT
jgi:amino acid adenylation domain-containing protein